VLQLTLECRQDSLRMLLYYFVENGLEIYVVRILTIQVSMLNATS
jgi:hypothetical protein